MDFIKNNWLTFSLIILAIISGYIIFNNLPSDQLNYVNIISLIGTIASFYGLIIAYIQIIKVASNTKTYEATFNKTIERLKRNDIIGVVSRAIQQISLIKKFYDLENMENTRENFNSLTLDLSILENSDRLNDDSKIITTFIEFCTEMETNILVKKIDKTEAEIRKNFNTLSEIQRYLVGLNEQYKTPEKN